MERYGKSGSVGKAFIKGFGLKSGALATSVGHDHHNLTAVGADPGDMALALNRIAEMDGGLAVAEGGKIMAEIPLPICGLLSPSGGEEVAERPEKCMKFCTEWGTICRLRS